MYDAAAAIPTPGQNRRYQATPAPTNQPRCNGVRLSEAMQDIRICLRGLRRAPVVAAVIVLSVGLGIGARATVFTAVNAALLRPLPYADADRLVRIYTDSPPNRFPFSVADYRALEAPQNTFTQGAAYGNPHADVHHR